MLFCRHRIKEEEPAKGILLHPHLWRGREDPYRYRMQIALTEKGGAVVDVLEEWFAIRRFREISSKGWFLNEMPFEMRPVAYAVKDLTDNRQLRRRKLRQDLEKIRDMGANTLCPIGGIRIGNCIASAMRWG